MTVDRLEFSSKHVAISSRASGRSSGFFLALILLFACSSAPVFAQENTIFTRAMFPATDAPLFRLPFTEGVSNADAFVHPQEHEGEEEHEVEHKNELALILAGTYESSEKANYFTTGFEYGRRLHPRIGVTAVFEYLTDIEAYLWVFQVTLHPKGSFKIFLGPGIERKPRRRSEESGESDHSESDSSDGEENSGSEDLFLFRIGAGYTFEFGERYSVTPALALDLVNEEHEVAKALVYGVIFGIGF